MHVRHIGVGLGCILAALAGCSGRSGAGVVCTPPECLYTTALQLVAEVDPPEAAVSVGAPLVAQEFASLSIDAHSGQFTLTLDAPVRVSGSVTVAGRALPPADAVVVASRRSRIAGRPNVSYQAPVDPVTGFYTLWLSPTHGDEAYSLRLSLDSADDGPPLTVELRDVTADREVDLMLDDPATLPEIHGAVVDVLKRPLAGMQVQAVDLSDDSVNPPPVVSTTSVTDGSGSYVIRLQRLPPKRIGLVATPTPSAPPATPTLSSLVDGDAVRMAQNLAVTLALPPLPAPVHVQYRIVGVSTSGAETPVVGATCTWRADVTDPSHPEVRAVHQGVGVSDGGGYLSTVLYPGPSDNRAYDMAVAADATSPFQSLRATVSVAPGAGGVGMTLVLPLRAHVVGRILGPDGKPVRQMQLQPSPASLAALVDGSAPAVPAFASGLGDNDGRFSLRLDTGLYDLGLIPPDDTSLPRLWRGVDVSSDVDLGDIEIPRGVMVGGDVRDGGGKPISGADVRLYTIAPGNVDCLNSGKAPGCLVPARLRAEVVSADDGHVAMILPSKPF